MNWLIVEDEADIRSLVSMMCQVWGNVPLAYESGQKAWDWLDAVESGQYKGAMPDFALMDIRMPGKRGNEISARIRTVKQLQHIPIVLMTAFVMSEDEMNQMKKDFGVDAVINKPLPDFDRLRTILYDIINRKKAETPPPSVEAPKPPVPTAEAPKPPVTTTEAPKPPVVPPVEAPKPPSTMTDTAKTQPSKPPMPTIDAPKTDAPMTETPSSDAPKPEATTPEPPKDLGGL
ncbi:MAG TPA: response regulator [Aggregatilineales bacterium]|nr:response regulator [Aggregatilineales bacterium]